MHSYINAIPREQSLNVVEPLIEVKFGVFTAALKLNKNSNILTIVKTEIEELI